MQDVQAVVIGAGIFGSLIARALDKAGCKPLVIDDRQKDAGSRPAACLMRPSWFSGVGKGVYEPALRKLDELVGVKDLTFKITVGSTTVHWCDPKEVLLPNDATTEGRVTQIALRSAGRWRVTFRGALGVETTVFTPLVVVAAGIWTPTLVPEIQVTAQGGVAWLYPELGIAEPFIQVWAPYKQIVGFNRGDGLWIGDGLSIQDWVSRHRDASRARCAAALRERSVQGLVSSPVELFGYRPYVKDAKPCYLKQTQKGLWVATGGAKNGTLAAGWCADQIVRAI